jgi:drug/metabolite transporter (DMT)-like permease
MAAPATIERAHALAYAGLAAATVGWAVGFVAGKVALGAMSPLPVAAWRYAVAAAVLLPFALQQRPAEGLGPVGRPLAWMVVSGGVLYPYLFLLALSRTSATNTSLMVALNPVLTLLLSPLAGERLERRRLAGVVVALAGAVVVITGGDAGRLADLSLRSGDLIAIAAAATWATFNVTSRHVASRLRPAFTNCLIYSLGAPALCFLGRGEHPWTQLAAATPAAVGGIVMMALFSSVMAGQFFLVGVRTVGVNRTVVFVYLVPVVTALLSTVLLGERFTASQALGGAAVLAGVYGSTRRGRLR